MFWFSVQIPYETFLILRRMHIAIHVKYPLLLSDFNKTWIFWTDFRKYLKYLNSFKNWLYINYQLDALIIIYS